MERPKTRRNTYLLHCPINNAAPAAPASLFADGDAGALPSMFQRPRAAPAPKPRTGKRRGDFPAYIIIAFLFAVAPLQVALLTSKERAVEEVLVAAKRSAAAIGTLLSMPSAEAAISSRSKSLPSAPAFPFEDGQFAEAAGMFKRLLAGQDAPAMKQAENDRLLSRLAVWVDSRARDAAEACPAPCESGR
jgi:hypothetical protein